MSPAHVFEPTYEAIKRRLMTGEWASGTRIEAARMADELGVSVTPVRDSLYRLNGERMVDFTHGEDRQSVGWGKCGSECVGVGGRRTNQKKKKQDRAKLHTN